MPYRHRIHVPGGTYYIIHRLSERHCARLAATGFACLAQPIPSALRQAGARLLGYCWTTEAIHFVLRTGERPAADFMREVIGRCSRALHSTEAINGPIFWGRHHLTLLEPDCYLGDAIRYLHYVPVSSGLAKDADAYPYSSHRAYLGGENVAQVQTRPLLHLIGGLDDGGLACHRLMAQPPEQALGTLLSRGQSRTPGILGSPGFIATLPSVVRGRLPLPGPSLDQIAAQVARLRSVPVQLIRSRSRRRSLVLARAQIAWYAVERQAATLGETAAYLRLSASSLTRAIVRYQARLPGLFSRDAFEEPALQTPPDPNAARGRRFDRPPLEALSVYGRNAIIDGIGRR